MKVGIITFPKSPSYGASLQMIALYYALKQIGCDVKVINYINNYMASEEHIAGNSKIMLRRMISNILNHKTKKRFKEFESQIEFFPKKTISSTEELRKIQKDFDYFICGSDQVWNPKITNADMNFFLKFCDDNSKKISYAPSFGYDSFDEKTEKKIAEEIIDFKELSVREESGKELIKRITGKSSEIVLDPTMLFDAEFWEKHTIRQAKLPSKYIVNFIFNPNKTVSCFTDEISRKKSLPVIYIDGSFLKRLTSKNYIGGIGPNGWLDIIKNAECVITDSFHGAVFSIIFKRELYVSLSSATNARLKTLLKMCGMENRCISNKEFFFGTDYDRVCQILNEERHKSIGFLKNALKEIE